MSTTSVPPDTKDWTWVLERSCAQCGFDAAAVPFTEVAGEVRRNADVWTALLGLADVRERPDRDVWSAGEYACHVRDVHLTFAERVRLMLGVECPQFADWDQDATATTERYDLQDPADVAPALAAAAAAVADLYDSVPTSALPRRGLRSNGSAFTVESMARYHLHDVVHHLWDVRRQVTVAAYDTAAAAYREASVARPDSVRDGLARFAADLGPGARALEIGSGPGSDAAAMEAAGLLVRRTDVSPGFVELLRADGHDAATLDPLTDDLTSPDGVPYDGVWASASLLHVARPDLPVVLTRLAEVTRSGGRLRMSVKEGEGDGWSTHGSVSLPRMFVYWREEPLREALTAAGWRVEAVAHRDGLRGEIWLEVEAAREEDA